MAMHFRVFHRLYSSSAIMADERGNIAAVLKDFLQHTNRVAFLSY